MIRFEVEYDPLKPIEGATSRAEKVFAAQVLKDTNPYVPALTGYFSGSARLEESTIVYPEKYARYLWNGKVMVDAQTGKGPAFIPDVGYRFRKDSQLTSTSRDLNYTKSTHPKAQAKWFIAAKKDNLQKWLKVAEKAVLDEYGK